MVTARAGDQVAARPSRAWRRPSSSQYPTLGHSQADAGLFTHRGRYRVGVKLVVVRDGAGSPDELTAALSAVVRPVLDGLPA